MREPSRLLLTKTGQESPSKEFEEFPLPVAEDWESLVQRADKMTDVIDRHLDFESKLQGRELRPNTLCPEQKVSMVSDLTAL
ncbi:MAG: hypothetical protein ABFD83_12045 [Armatimonadota bacterium]